MTDIPLWKRVYRGQVGPGWLGRSTGQDQPPVPDEPSETVRVIEPGAKRTSLPDRPYKPEDHWTERDRRPLMPEALRAPREAVEFAVRHALWVVGFHLVRIPVYLGRNVLWAPRGLTRLLTGLTRWARVYESRDVEWSAADAAITAREPSAYATYNRIRLQRRDQVRSRAPMAGLAVAGAMVLTYVGLTRWETAGPTVLALVLGLGWSGRPMDRPYIESAVVSSPKARKITPDQIIRALHAAKLCKETVGPDAPEFVSVGLGRDGGVGRDGAGWTAIVDLPYGYTAAQAIERRTQIAAGLRVDEFQVFIKQVRGNGGHAGRIEMWIADLDPHTQPAGASPLVKADSFNLWNKVPFGRDEKSRHVAFPLIWTSMLIGALPRMGKTNVLRVLTAAAALDPWARIICFDGKGGADLAPLEAIAHAFGVGSDRDVAKALRDTLATLVEDMRRRYSIIRSMPRSECPQAKLTKNLSRDRKRDMPITLIVVDEFQLYLGSEYGEQIYELLKTLVQVGPGAGFIVVLSTQRPSSTIMKTDLRDSMGLRYGMRSATRESSEMIMGSGSYKAGLDTTRFEAEHRGVGILLGTDDSEMTDKGPLTVHSYLLDLPEFEAICKRGRALREGADTLSGVAAGEENEALSDRVLEHVAAAFRGEEQAHSQVLVARMADDHPGLYEGWGQNDLAVALGRYGIPAGQQIWAVPLEGGKPGNRKGFRLEQVLDKVLERTDDVPDSPTDDL